MSKYRNMKQQERKQKLMSCGHGSRHKTQYGCSKCKREIEAANRKKERGRGKRRRS